MKPFFIFLATASFAASAQGAYQGLSLQLDALEAALNAEGPVEASLIAASDDLLAEIKAAGFQDLLVKCRMVKFLLEERFSREQEAAVLASFQEDMAKKEEELRRKAREDSVRTFRLVVSGSAATLSFLMFNVFADLSDLTFEEYLKETSATRAAGLMVAWKSYDALACVSLAGGFAGLAGFTAQFITSQATLQSALNDVVIIHTHPEAFTLEERLSLLSADREEAAARYSRSIQARKVMHFWSVLLAGAGLGSAAAVGVFQYLETTAFEQYTRFMRSEEGPAWKASVDLFRWLSLGFGVTAAASAAASAGFLLAAPDPRTVEKEIISLDSLIQSLRSQDSP